MSSLPRPRPLLVALALLFSACGGKHERPGTPPDRLLLITIEGVRPDHLSACGYVRETTCVEGSGLEFMLDLDHLATQGVSFARAFAPSGSLRPSLATLMTGRSPLEHRLFDEEETLDPSLPTLAGGFLAAGFETGAAVFSPRDFTASGLDRGFARFEVVADQREVLSSASKMLHQWAKRGSPFFLWMHFGGLGPPFEGGAFQDQFSVSEGGGYQAGVASPAAWAAGEVENNARNRARLNDLYDGEVQQLARLLDEFFVHYYEQFERHLAPDDLGTNPYRDTLFVVAGTSGMELAERGAPCGNIGSEGSLVDTALRVPLILRHPQSLTGRRILDEVVELGDVAPTIREWFALEDDPGASGRSLLALTDSYTPRDFSSRPALGLRLEARGVTGYTLRDEAWRVIFDSGGVELYRIERDPRCRRNLATDSPARVDEWKTRLDVFREGLEAPGN